MLTARFAKACVLPALFGLAAGPLAVHGQTLDAVLSAAVPVHPRVKAAQASARAAGFDIEQAKAAWSPRFGVVADPGAIAGAGSGSAPGDLGLRGSKLLYDGGKADAETTRQESRATAALQRVNAAVEQQAAQLSDLYLEAYKQQLLAAEAQKNVTAHVTLVASVAEIANVDRGRKSDLDQANARLDQARVTLSTRQSAYIEARAQLVAAARTPVTSVVAARDVSGLLPPSEAAAQAAVDTHPLILAARADVDAATQASVIADAWQKPRIDLQGTLQRDPTTTARRYLRTLDVRLVSNWTGFDGGGAAAAANASREQVQATVDTLETTRRDLQSEVSRHWNALASRVERRSAWDRLVNQLTGVRDNYWEQFKIGRRSILDLLNVENEIFQARTSAQTDLAEAEQSRYRLLGATARLSDLFNLPQTQPRK